MIEMTARIPLDGEVIPRADLLAFAEQVRAHEDSRVELDYDEDSLCPVALEAFWTTDGGGDDSQQ